MPTEFKTSVHTNALGKQSFLKMLLRPEQFENELVFLVWMKNILKSELFKIDGVTVLLIDFQSLCVL